MRMLWKKKNQSKTQNARQSANHKDSILNKINESFADLENNLKCPIELQKSLVFLDIEATGPDPQIDRVIEIHGVRFEPDGSKRSYYSLVNPTEPIPAESTKIHGFTNKDLSQAPAFKKISTEVVFGYGTCHIKVV